MPTLTDANIKALEACRSADEWNATCLDLKKEHGGFPTDWWDKVHVGGLGERVAKGFGEKFAIRVTSTLTACPTCQTTLALYCPDGCGLATPWSVCPKCDPEGSKRREKMVGVKVCAAYMKKQMGK